MASIEQKLTGYQILGKLESMRFDAEKTYGYLLQLDVSNLSYDEKQQIGRIALKALDNKKRLVWNWRGFCQELIPITKKYSLPIADNGIVTRIYTGRYIEPNRWEAMIEFWFEYGDKLMAKQEAKIFENANQNDVDGCRRVYESVGMKSHAERVIKEYNRFLETIIEENRQRKRKKAEEGTPT